VRVCYRFARQRRSCFAYAGTRVFVAACALACSLRAAVLLRAAPPMILVLSAWVRLLRRLAVKSRRTKQRDLHARTSQGTSGMAMINSTRTAISNFKWSQTTQSLSWTTLLGDPSVVLQYNMEPFNQNASSWGRTVDRRRSTLIASGRTAVGDSRGAAALADDVLHRKAQMSRETTRQATHNNTQQQTREATMKQGGAYPLRALACLLEKKTKRLR
jgi:hypothetical protein